MFRCSMALGLAMAVGLSTASAQPRPKGPPRGGDDTRATVKKLESELERLRDQLRDLEAKLQKARAASGPESPWKFGTPFGKGGEKGKGWDKKESGKWKDMGERFKKAFEGMKKEFGQKGPKGSKGFQGERNKEFPKGPPGSPWGGKGKFGGFGPMRGWQPPSRESSIGSLERRLDRIIRDLEDLRRDLKKR